MKGKVSLLAGSWGLGAGVRSMQGSDSSTTLLTLIQSEQLLFTGGVGFASKFVLWAASRTDGLWQRSPFEATRR